MAAQDVPYLRTPADRFDLLPDFAYQPRFLQRGNLRMAYVDETCGGGSDTFLCLHGQPTWSFLYRRMIPVLLKYTTQTQSPSRRVVAPDLFGFGRSDKPTREEDYTFTFHRESLLHLIRTLDLRNITLVVQDWGGILGLTLPLAEPWRFRRLIVMNTAIATGADPGPGFLEWLDFSNRTPDMDVGALLKRSCGHLSESEVNAYNAPFPSQDYKAGVRRFPNLVMIKEHMEGVNLSRESLRLYQETDQFRAEDVFMACGRKDPVLGPAFMERLSKVWKNGCWYMEVEEAGHFVQEWGAEVAVAAIQAYEQGGGNDIKGVRKVENPKGNL